MAYLHSSTPTYMPLFLAPNICLWSDLVTSSDMVTNIPNPSSQIGTFPGSYILDPLRQNMWRSRGLFRIYSDTDKGYVMAPNDKLYFNIGGSDITASITNNDYTDPYDLAQEIITQLEANDASSTYTVTFSDKRKDGSSATFKWTLTRDAGGTFQLIGDNASYTDSILPSLGFEADTDYTGATTYTSDHRACHTEEYIIIKVPNDVMASMLRECGGDSGGVGAWQFITLLDTNLRFGAGKSWANDGPKQMPKIFLYGFNNYGDIEFDKPDSDFTETYDMFTFPSTDPFPSYIGIDSQMYGGGWNGASGYSSNAIYYHKMILCDMTDWTNTYDPASNPSNYGGYSGHGTYLKIKISDPRHPDGFAQIGTVHLAPAWYPDRATEMDRTWYMADENRPDFAPGGTRLNSGFAQFRRMTDLRFKYISDGDPDSSGATNYQGTDSPWIEWNERLFSRWIQDHRTNGNTPHITEPDPAALGIGRQPLVYVDRAWKPIINREEKDASGTYNRQGYTPSAMYCTVADSGEWVGSGVATDYWDWQVSLKEEL